MERTNNLNKIHVIALAAMAILFLSPLVQADVGVGAIVIDSQIEGKGDLDTNGGVNVGDIITTGPKGNVTILFDDESMLTLGPNAKAQVVKYSETPAPGVSEIKIISGTFRYFPGIILENGGKQVLNNIGGSRATDAVAAAGSDLSLSSTEQPLDDDSLSSLNEQLTDINSQISASEFITSTGAANTANTGGSGAGQGEGGIETR